MSKEISNGALEILIRLELPKLKRYKDQAGNDTIGVGHLITRIDPNLRKVTGLAPDLVTELTYKQVSELLKLDLSTYEMHVNLLCPDVSQCAFDALVLFTFNVGMRGFEKSSVYSNISKNKFILAAESMMLYKYITIGGRKIISKGLIKRRFIEANILSTPVLRTNLASKELTTTLMNEAIDIITDYYSKYKG